MSNDTPHVWIAITCGSCGVSWHIRVNKDWLDMKAVVPHLEQCSKCRAKAKRFAKRWHNEAFQLRIRFDEQQEGGQDL